MSTCKQFEISITGQNNHFDRLVSASHEVVFFTGLSWLKFLFHLADVTGTVFATWNAFHTNGRTFFSSISTVKIFLTEIANNFLYIPFHFISKDRHKLIVGPFTQVGDLMKTTITVFIPISYIGTMST
jgi:hypothetical protein